MSYQLNHSYRFTPFLLLPTERLLLRDGRVVPLAPKVLETLLLLVENSGQILSKEELMQSLWPDTFVEESNLTQNISQIRKALGAGEWVETIPKRGYRFAAEVQREAKPNEANGQALPVQPLTARNGTNGAAPRNGHVAAPLSPPLSIPISVWRGKRVALWVAGIIIGLGWLGLWLWNRTATSQVTNLFQQLTLTKLTTSGQASQAALSHDGKYVAYVEGTSDAQGLYLRQVRTTSQTTLVPPADARFLGVTFAPDDTFVYYVLQSSEQPTGTLYQIPLLGGTAKKMMSGIGSPITLSPDGQHVAFVRRTPTATTLLHARLDGSAEHALLTRQMPEMVSVQGPAWSPDGQWIACAVGNGVSGESALQIFAVNATNGATHAIGREHWSAVGQLAWLQDGSGLLFPAWRSTSGVYGDPLWLLTYPQGTVRQVTHDLSGYQGSAVSADATALVTRQMTRVSRLWLLPANGATIEAERATPIPSGFGDNFSEYFGLDWTPDGNVVYASHASGNLDLWRSTTDGKQQQLTRDPHTDLMPAVTADGRYIVFVSDRSGTRALWRMETNGNNPQQLTRGKGDAAPSLTPDGKWVIYSSLGPAPPHPWPSLWKVPIEGGDPVALTTTPTFQPRVSPDGNWVACFSQTEAGNRSKLVVIPLKGGEPRLLDLAATPDITNLGWLPDSRAVCYSVTHRGVSNLWISPLEGSPAKPLTHFTSEQIFRFAWSHDGKWLACERGQALSEAVLIGHRAHE